MNTALSMKSGKRKKAAILDPHHTHFLLVDDGRDGEDITFGGEIGFRAAFEQCNDTENHSEGGLIMTSYCLCDKELYPVLMLTNSVYLTNLNKYT